MEISMEHMRIEPILRRCLSLQESLKLQDYKRAEHEAEQLRLLICAQADNKEEWKSLLTNLAMAF